MIRYILCTAVFLMTTTTGADDFPAIDYSPSAVFNDPEEATEGTPQVIVDAPDSVFIGDMIVIDLSDSIGNGFDLRIIPEPSVVRVFNEGRIITASTGDKPIEYLFIFSCAIADKSDVKTKVIRVEQRTPPAPPKPPKPPKPPTPPKPPVEPDSLLGRVITWCEDVQSPTARDDALKLQQSFSTLAMVIESGAFSDVAQIMSATKESNADALGANKVHWDPFLDKLAEELRTMFDAGQLPTIESHSKVWTTVSKGLQQFADREEVK